MGIGITITAGAALSVMNGNVGIGTWVPAYQLDMGTGTVLANGYAFAYTSSSPGAKIYSPSTQIVAINTNGIERMRIDNVGNIGIGTTTSQGSFVVTNGNVGIGTWDRLLHFKLMGRLKMFMFLRLEILVLGRQPPDPY